ncbi:MAG: GGDEF domain-containing protein [Pseudobutyrivibrio sp.]|nr:GGDEF domain-containing protein [Pseudobutyrivibrio sp.]
MCKLFMGLDGGTYIGLVVCVTLIIFIVTMRSFDRDLRKKFIYTITALCIALIMSYLDMHYALEPTVNPLRYVARIIKLIAEGYMEVSVLRIFIKDINKVNDKVIWLPFIVASVVLLMAPVNREVFYFTPDNEYVRGPLGNVIFVEAIIYMALALRICIKKWFEGFQRDAVTMLSMLMMTAVGVIFENEKIFPNCALNSSAVCIIFLYMYMYAERYNVDSVSRCYKRRCFYADAAKYARNQIAIISMDLNDLKFINDNYGHKSGDIALLTFAEVVRSVKTNKFILYRTGGDEFMILGIKASLSEAKELVEYVREKLKETPYTCSFGINMYNPGDDFDAAVVKADKAMYADKNAYKESRTKRSRSRVDDFENINLFSNNINFLN